MRGALTKSHHQMSLDFRNIVPCRWWIILQFLYKSKKAKLNFLHCPNNSLTPWLTSPVIRYNNQTHLWTHRKDFNPMITHSHTAFGLSLPRVSRADGQSLVVSWWWASGELSLNLGSLKACHCTTAAVSQAPWLNAFVTFCLCLFVTEAIDWSGDV